MVTVRGLRIQSKRWYGRVAIFAIDLNGQSSTVKYRCGDDRLGQQLADQSRSSSAAERRLTLQCRHWLAYRAQPRGACGRFASRQPSILQCINQLKAFAAFSTPPPEPAPLKTITRGNAVASRPTPLHRMIPTRSNP
jgi:hypothetical protein